MAPLLQVWCISCCYCTHPKQFSSLWDVKWAVRKANIVLVNTWNDSSGLQHAEATIGGLNISLQFPWPMSTDGSIELPSNRRLPVPDIRNFAGRLAHQVGINGSLPPLHLAGVGNFGFSIETFLLSFDEGNMSSIQIGFSIPGWDALNKFQFKVVQPKLVIQLGFLNKTFQVKAKGFITALDQVVSHSKSTGLPVQLVFPKHLGNSLEIGVADLNAIAGFDYLVPLLSARMDEEILKTISGISQNIKVPKFVLRVASGFSNITIVNIKTTSMRPFKVLGKMTITNATFELTQTQQFFHANVDICGQQFSVAMLKDNSQFLTLEVNKDIKSPFPIKSFLSCVEERSDRRPDIKFVRMNPSSFAFRLDQLKISLRSQPKLELAKIIILAGLPTEWNIFDQALLKTTLLNSTLSIKVTNPPGSSSVEMQADVFGHVVIGNPTLLAFPFVIRIPTKARPLLLSLQDGKKIEVDFNNILKIGALSSSLPSFMTTTLRDILVRKLTLQFPSTLTGSFQITEFLIDVASETKWNLRFFQLGNLRMVYSLNHTLLSGQIFLGNFSLHCQLEWPPSPQGTLIKLSKSVAIMGFSSFASDVHRTFYGSTTLRQTLNALARTKLSAIPSFTLQTSSFFLANDLSLKKATFTGALPKYSWELLNDFFDVADVSFSLEVDVGKAFVIFIRGVMVLIGGKASIPFEMNIPLSPNKTLTIGLPANKAPRVLSQQLTGILTTATTSKFPAILESFLPEFTLEKLEITFDKKLTVFKINKFRAVCNTPWDLGGIGALSVKNATVFMTPQLFELRGFLSLGNTNMELVLKNSTTGRVFSLVKPVNTSGLDQLVKDALKKLNPGLRILPEVNLLGLDLIDASFVTFAEVQFSNNFDNLSSFALEVEISKAWSFLNLAVR